MGRTHLSRCVDFGHFRFSHNIMRISQISQISEQIGETATTSQDNISSWLFDFPNFCLLFICISQWEVAGGREKKRVTFAKSEKTDDVVRSLPHCFCRTYVSAKRKETALRCSTPWDWTTLLWPEYLEIWAAVIFSFSVRTLSCRQIDARDERQLLLSKLRPVTFWAVSQ